MDGVRNVRVTRQGQLSLPAPVRRRWKVEHGGELGVIDLGSAVVLIPGGARAARRALGDAFGAGRYLAAVRELNDPELATQ